MQQTGVVTQCRHTCCCCCCSYQGWDKTYCLQFVEKDFDEIHFFGDKTFPVSVLVVAMILMMMVMLHSCPGLHAQMLLQRTFPPLLRVCEQRQCGLQPS